MENGGEENTEYLFYTWPCHSFFRSRVLLSKFSDGLFQLPRFFPNASLIIG